MHNAFLEKAREVLKPNPGVFNDRLGQSLAKRALKVT